MSETKIANLGRMVLKYMAEPAAKIKVSFGIFWQDCYQSISHLGWKSCLLRSSSGSHISYFYTYIRWKTVTKVDISTFNTIVWSPLELNLVHEWLTHMGMNVRIRTLRVMPRTFSWPSCSSPTRWATTHILSPANICTADCWSGSECIR